MANKRIKDLGTTATSLASDDFVAVDGSSQGTRKIQKANLVNDISSEIAGTYLDEANNLSDVASKDTSKLNLEVPDVGTAPNEVPLSGQLGTMAFQDASGVSVGQLEVTDKIDLSGAPTQQLEVYGDAPTVRVTDTSDGVGDGDSIGKLEFYGNDGSSGGVGVRAKIDTVSETAAGNQYGVAISTSTANSTPVERVRVDGSGLVGIGTASPSAVTEITGAGTGGRGLKITETTSSKSNGVYTLEVDSSAHGSNTSAAGAMKIDVASGRAVTVDGTGRMGLGTDSPGSYDGNADDLVVATNGNTGISIRTSSTGSGAIYFAEGTSGTERYKGYLAYSQNTDTMTFGTSESTKWQINSSGDLVAYAAGVGIDFGSGATLDDYEIGSHTTTVGVSGSGSVTMNSSFDRIGYTIIGDSVGITGLLKVSSVSSPVGALEITLPTVPANFTESGAAGGGAVAYYDASANSWSNVPFTFEEGSSTVSIKLDASTLAASDQIRLSFVYFQA